jgi:metal-responsive CopG/Arc/MetJ family transcriptional regulator
MRYSVTINKILRKIVMPTVGGRSQKTRITVTLGPELVRQLDAFLDSPEIGSRSQLVEKAIRKWLEIEAQKELDHQTEQYYQTLSEDERREDKEWTKLAARSARRLWDR